MAHGYSSYITHEYTKLEKQLLIDAKNKCIKLFEPATFKHDHLKRVTRTIGLGSIIVLYKYFRNNINLGVSDIQILVPAKWSISSYKTKIYGMRWLFNHDFIEEALFMCCISNRCTYEIKKETIFDFFNKIEKYGGIMFNVDDEKLTRALNTVGKKTMILFYPYLRENENISLEDMRTKLPIQDWTDASWETKLSTAKRIFREMNVADALYLCATARRQNNSKK